MGGGGKSKNINLMGSVINEKHSFHFQLFDTGVSENKAGLYKDSENGRSSFHSVLTASQVGQLSVGPVRYGRPLGWPNPGQYVGSLFVPP